MTDSIQVFDFGFRVTDVNGVPVNGAQIQFFQAGTTTPLTVYADAALSSSLGSIVYTRSDGLPVTAQNSTATTLVYTGASPYKLQINDSNNNPIIPVQDNISGAIASLNTTFAKPLTVITNISANYTVQTSDLGSILNCNTTAGSFTITLLTAVGINGKGVTIKNVGTGGYPVLLATTSSQTIDGSTTGTIYALDDARTIVSDNANWWISGAVIAAQIPGSVTNLHIFNDATTPNTKLDVTCDEAVMISSGGVAMRATSVSIVIDATVNGANGLDISFLAVNTWYYVWLISNGTTTAGLLSLSSTAPLMPSGYVFKKRVGARYTDTSSLFFRMQQFGRRHQYQVVAASNTAALPNFASGVAGTVGHTSAPTWVQQSMNSAIPPTATEAIIVYMNNFNNTTASLVQLASNGNTSGDETTNPPLVSIPSGAIAVGVIQFIIEPLSNNSIYWASSAAGGALFCLGFIDNF